MDSRYRSYGKLNSVEMPYRSGVGGGSSDIMTVGKIDSTVSGMPYESFKKDGTTDSYAILKDFHRKKEGVGFFDGRFEFSGETGTKLDLVTKQFEIEAGFDTAKGYAGIIAMVESWKANHPGEPPVFEITNEPNMFPYLSPVTYAYMYKMWVDAIKKTAPDALIMNGGLWIFEGLPEAIIENLDLMKVYVNSAAEYYRQFYDIVSKIDRDKYTPDILNLHFYPYVGVHKKCDLEEQVEHLKRIIAQSPYKKEVWLTEFGNVNPYDEVTAASLMKRVFEHLEKTDIKRWYYFKMSGTDHKFNGLVQQEKLIGKVKWIYWCLTLLLRIPGIFYCVNWVMREFNIPTLKDIDCLFEMANKYLKNLPYQGLEEDGKLNMVGQIYFNKANA